MKKLGLLLVLMIMVQAILPASVCKAEEELESLSKPQVCLTSYSLNNENVVLGADNSIHLEFTNFSSLYPVTDVLVSFSSGNHTIVPVYGKSNQVYISEIAANSTAEVDVPITIVGHEFGYTSLTFVVEYCAGGVLLNNQMMYIVIPVDVEEKLVVDNVSLSSSAEVNSKVSLLVGYTNDSEEVLEDVYLTINGADFERPIEMLMKERLMAGEKGYFEYYLSFDTVGTKRLSLEVKSVDEFGNEHTIDAGEYSVVVTEEDLTENNTNTQQGDTTEQPEESSDSEMDSLKLYIAIGLIAAVIVVCLLVGVISSKKRAR